MSKLEIINNTILSVKVIFYKRSNNKVLFLVLKEEEGIFGFVGGAKEERDKTVKDAAKREIHEEIGLVESAYCLNNTLITYEFIHSDNRSPRYGLKGKVHIFLAELLADQPLKLESDIVHYEWLSNNEVIVRLKESYPYLKSLFIQATKNLE